MTDINSFIDRARVILTSAVTWISAAIVVIQFALTTEPLSSIPEVAQYGGHVVAFLAGVIAIIRRVTPVPAEDKGLL
jgi:hypothetical protein